LPKAGGGKRKTWADDGEARTNDSDRSFQPVLGTIASHITAAQWGGMLGENATSALSKFLELYRGEYGGGGRKYKTTWET